MCKEFNIYSNGAKLRSEPTQGWNELCVCKIATGLVTVQEDVEPDQVEDGGRSLGEQISLTALTFLAFGFDSYTDTLLIGQCRCSNVTRQKNP